MNRLRKKSDAHQSQLSQSSVLDGQFSIGALPQLPTTNDFRTSLILPDLSRRFSLLRSSTADPAAFDNHLRNRLADQRARGAENQITEEEEDMLLDALGRLRIRRNTVESSQESLNGTGDAASGAGGADENGRKSSTSSTSTTNVSPNGRSGKRYSNNLFGSGRLRDYTYLRTISSSKSSSSSTRTVSLTPTEASVQKTSTSSLLPVTPDRTVTPPTSIHVTDVETNEDSTTPYHLEAVEYQLQSQLGPSNLNRASMALQQAIKEIEDELEEEILLPRTTPIPRGNLDQVMPEDRDSHSSASSIFEGGMAISIDQSFNDNPSERGASPIPARTIPGYVPGMPRPMTPRDVDLEEQRSHSTTPRAQSPSVMESIAPLNAVTNSTGKVRRDSTSSMTKSLAAAPLFLQRSTNGRYTPTPTTQVDDGERSGSGDASDLDSSLGPFRRRPASPLSGSSYQSMTISSRSNSRPGTPSNVIWTPNASLNGHGRRPSHIRTPSLTSDGEMDYHGAFGIHARPGGPRALRSPPPEQEPGRRAQSPLAYNASPTKDQSPPNSSGRPKAIVGEREGPSQPAPVQPTPRAATPTQIIQRSPASPAFGKRVSRQNQPSSPFNLSAFPGLGLSARANSSRSSLDSVGSSFHSWDESDKVFGVFTDPKEQQLMWHEFSSSVTPGDESDPEDVLKRFGGLNKGDIAAIQEKLVAAALMKITNIDPRDRAPSALRRRRPSTSQSNYTRIASPPPQVQPPASPTSTSNDDQYSRASALLNSVVDSIKDQPSTLNTGPITKVPSTSSDDISPATRRNRALALVLFGEEDTKDPDSLSPKEERIKSIPEHQAVVSTPLSENSGTNFIHSNAPSAFNPSTQSLNSQHPNPAYTVHRNISLTRVPQTPQQEAELVREVQKKAEAAMIALNKTSSTINLPEGLSHSSSIRRRVDPRDISQPKLVSTSNDLDSLPLTQINNNGSSSKLGSRFKRLRGSLRAKSTASSEEIATTSVKTPPANQEAFYDPAKFHSMTGNLPASSGPSDQPRFKTSVPTPPASAGPGLKGFMARFRNKQRMSETPPTERPVVIATPATAPVTPVSPAPRSADTVTPNSPASPEKGVSLTSTTRSPGQPRPMYSRFPPASVPVAQAPTSIPQPQVQLPAQPSAETLQPPDSPSTAQSQAALQQLFRAANDLGLDQNALTDLLSRSDSVSSRNLLQRNNTVAASVSKPGIAPSDVEQVSYVASTGSDQTATPANYATLSSKQEAKADVRPMTPEESTVRKTSRKTELLRRVKEGQTETNPVVRITRIYANDAPELVGLMQRKNSARRKRISATSVSSRSVYDRVPTPPPPKPSAKRFSADRMPPMPHLPNFLGQVGQPSNAPTNHVQSTYDSLYDMYSGESRVVSMAVGDDGQPSSEAQPAVEVIELANGEAIWNIVNGLRDGDDVSVYSHSSFVSEYPPREEGGENAKPFVKGHNRSESKGSVSSFISSTKGQQGKSRPETKVFYSTSEQIGRLIESLSQGADAGSFNFLPSFPSERPSHSKSSSLSTNDINWTVEERLEQMLGAINNASS